MENSLNKIESYKHKERADLFLIDIKDLLPVYKKKWATYFYEKGYKYDPDLLGDTIVKCYDTIGRLGCKDGQQESFNYLFKAFQTNTLRELEYARNKYRTEVEDINVVYETYMNTKTTADYKIVKDIWVEFQFNYLLKEVEYNWDKGTFYLYKLKFVLQKSDEEILKKTHNPNWKKTIKNVTKWLKASVSKEDIIKEFNVRYPDIDLNILSE